MRSAYRSPISPSGGASLNSDVREAFEAWDVCYCGIASLRQEYDAAMQLHDRHDGPDPAAMRGQLKALQAECDKLYFSLLKVAEERMRERYI
jgi:hypothetical protein